MLPFIYFIKSFLIGFIIATPIGPIGILCIRKTLELGIQGALFVGLGAALADTVYGLIASFSLTAISAFLSDKFFYLNIAGGLFLLYLTYQEFKKAPSLHSAMPHFQPTFTFLGKIKLTTQVFFIIVSNPMALLLFMSVFASVLEGPVTWGTALSIPIGVFCGSLTWWLLLGNVIIIIHHKLPKIWLLYINYASAAMLGGFSIFAFINALRTW